jgi:uncharacterized protein YjbI with pentapeptide repeats
MPSWVDSRNAQFEAAFLPVDPGADDRIVDLSGASFVRAQLKRANLSNSHLEGVDFANANLQEANLSASHMERTRLIGATLAGADLRTASFDGDTLLTGVVLDSATRLGDIRWGGIGAVDLTQIDWQHVPQLGDQTMLNKGSTEADYAAAVRAFRQVTAQLRMQSLNDVADNFSELAQNLQRGVYLRDMLAAWKHPKANRRHLRRATTRWFTSCVSCLFTGYGYRPGRTIAWYLAIISLFAFAYAHVGRISGHHFELDEAIVFSLTSFHGRGFFPGTLNLRDPVVKLAAFEAVLGLLVEISFIATFTQRFFGAK